MSEKTTVSVGFGYEYVSSNIVVSRSALYISGWDCGVSGMDASFSCGGSSIVMGLSTMGVQLIRKDKSMRLVKQIK